MKSPHQRLWKSWSLHWWDAWGLPGKIIRVRKETRSTGQQAAGESVGRY